MAAIILPHRWKRAPQQAVEVNWANPITRGLLEVMFPFLYRSLVGRVVPTFTGSFPKSYALGGAGRVTQFGGTDKIVYAGAWSRINFPLTMMHVHTFVSGGASYRAAGNFLANSYGYGTLPNSTTQRWATATGSNNLISGATYTPFSLYVDMMTAEAGSQAIYLNGVQRATASAATMTTPTGDFSIGLDNAATFTAGMHHHAAAVWSRVLSRAEVQALADAPYQLVRPLRRRIYSLPGAAAAFRARPYYDLIGQSRLGA
jgi:hypothetical protein